MSNRLMPQKTQLAEPVAPAYVSAPFTEPTPSAVCQFVLIYDDEEARNRAACLCEKLRRACDSEVGFQTSWWKFSNLSERAMRHLAAEDAAHADLVLFSLGSQNDLPAELVEFNSLWVEQRQNRDGLLAVLFHNLSDALPGVASLQNYFAGLARQAGLDFIINFEADAAAGTVGVNHAKLDRERFLKPLIDEYFCPSQWTLA